MESLHVFDFEFISSCLEGHQVFKVLFFGACFRRRKLSSNPASVRRYDDAIGLLGDVNHLENKALCFSG